MPSHHKRHHPARGGAQTAADTAAPPQPATDAAPDQPSRSEDSKPAAATAPSAPAGPPAGGDKDQRRPGLNITDLKDMAARHRHRAGAVCDGCLHLAGDDQRIHRRRDDAGSRAGGGDVLDVVLRRWKRRRCAASACVDARRVAGLCCAGATRAGHRRRDRLHAMVFRSRNQELGIRNRELIPNA